MYPVGLSTNIYPFHQEVLQEMKEAGISYLELSCPPELYPKMDFCSQAERAEAAGIKIWSVHLPFHPFSKIDPSFIDVQKRVDTQNYFKEIIRRASEAGITKFIMHPSGEPIDPAEREARLQAAEETIKVLSDYAHSLGSVLCVENLPRTCLGNGIAEMKRLLAAGEHVRMCFDVNHNLFDDNLQLLEELGDKIVTLHISDYDRVDERHWLPGEGCTDWQALYAKLKEKGYSGVWLYELGLTAPRTIVRRKLTYQDYTDNAHAIFEGKEPPKLYTRKRKFLLQPRDTIWLGANYYPEDWDEDELESDIAKMKEMGFNVVRIGEFAWKKDEPQEGEFHFDWLHRVVDTLGAAGIKTIMGTPTATPPHWLLLKHPDMAYMDENGQRRHHGGRRHCCSCNPHYRHYSAIIVEKLGQEFGKDPNIIGWQLDNEICDPICHCPHCVESFHRYLKEKYGSVEAINKAWNLNLFSQAYDTIDEIPLPTHGWHNPHLILEWRESQSQNHIDFIHLQAEILHRYTDAPIGTDTMPTQRLNYREMNRTLDVAQFNHYNRADTLSTPAMWMDYMRHFSSIPFWNTETQPCWNGSTDFGNPLQPEGFIYMNTWLPILLGGEANLYWLWRTHWAGHELMHGAVLESCGRYTYAAEEIKKAGREIRQLTDLLCKSTVRQDTALQLSSRNHQMWRGQNFLKDLGGNEAEVQKFYQQLLKTGIHPDVIDSCEDLSKYKLLITPLCYTLEEGDFQKRVTEWVQNGGVWVTGPLTDIRTAVGTKYKTSPYGFLEELTGARQAYFTPDADGRLTFTNEEGKAVACTRSYELFETNGLEPWITVTEGHSALLGKTCVAAARVGKGAVILLGTFPEAEELQRIYAKAASMAKATRYTIFGEGTFVTHRRGGGYDVLIAASLEGKACGLRFEGRKKDLLTGTVYENEIALNPFQIAVLADTE